MGTLTAQQRYIAAINEFRRHEKALFLAMTRKEGLLLAELFFDEDTGSLGPEHCYLYLRADWQVLLRRHRGNWNVPADEEIGKYLVEQGINCAADILLGPDEFVRRIETRDAHQDRVQRRRS